MIFLILVDVDMSMYLSPTSTTIPPMIELSVCRGRERERERGGGREGGRERRREGGREGEREREKVALKLQFWLAIYERFLHI